MIAAGVTVLLIAATVTPVFVVNAVRVLANDWLVRHELGRDDFPADRRGLGDDDRLALALTGLRSIRPGSEGVALLERATLPDGSAAFNSRELRHMGDVRGLLGAALRVQLIVLGVLLVLAVALRRSPRWRTVVPRGLQIGALATFGFAVLAVPVVLLGFDGFFFGFHQVFFSGDSWRFSTTDTLLRLYPETFWQDSTQLAAAIVIVQAAVVTLFATWWLRRVSPKPGTP